MSMIRSISRYVDLNFGRSSDLSIQMTSNKILNTKLNINILVVIFFIMHLPSIPARVAYYLLNMFHHVLSRSPPPNLP